MSVPAIGAIWPAPGMIWSRITAPMPRPVRLRLGDVPEVLVGRLVGEHGQGLVVVGLLKQAGGHVEPRPDDAGAVVVPIAQPVSRAATTKAPAVAPALIGPGSRGPAGWRPRPPAASTSPGLSPSRTSPRRWTARIGACRPRPRGLHGSWYPRSDGSPRPRPRPRCPPLRLPAGIDSA